MAVIRPFRGLRPRPEDAGRVAAPPYDVLNAREARDMAKGNPLSFLHVNKAEIDLDENVNPYSEQVYRRGKENLHRLMADGTLFRDVKPCLYLYRLTWQGRSQTGLVTLTSVDEYDRGIIKKHEHTRPEKVNDRASHISYLEAQVGPVFSIFRQNSEIAGIFAEVCSRAALVDFTADDHVRHELWVVDTDAVTKRLVGAFARLPYLYIADGHHRSQSASEVCRREREKNPHFTGEESYNFFLNVLFADSELRILPYNRVIRDLGSLTPDQLFEKASTKFDIKTVDGPVEPDRVHVFGAYCGGGWRRLEAKAGTFDRSHPTRSIDASVLADNLIAPLLGITDPKTDKRIDFVGGIRGTKELVKLVDSGEHRLAFSLFPTSIEQLLKVADAGEVMPPKSTWFEPKLRDGMVVNLLTD
jgi:uncharacterized protein (DUF1015 family)